MQVKIDFSEDCKANNYSLERPGTYAIYVRKNCFHKWKQIQAYADASLALYEFRKLEEAAHAIEL